jgi:hypothetical protein
MAMKKCKECGKEVSSKADKCPNCGAPIKAKSVGCGGCLVVVLIIVGALMFLTKKANDFANTPEGKAAAARRAEQDAADEKARQVEQAAQRQRDADAAKSRADAAAKLRKDAPTFSADQVVANYKNNEVAADAALKGKVFKVKGKIERIGKDVLNTSYVAINAERADAIRSVQCFFDDSHLSELAALRPGQEVIIFGKCDGLMMNVLMKECELMKE